MGTYQFFKTGWMKLVTALLVISLVAAPASNPPAAAQAGYLVRAGSAAQAVKAIQACGGALTSTLDLIESAGASLAAAQLDCVKARPGVLALTANAPVKIVGNGTGEGPKSPATDYPDVTGANLVWSRGQDTGAGVTVAVVDTGISELQALTRGVDGDRNRLIGWVDLVSGKKNPSDPNGHGTHVAGVIANSQIGADGEWNGMAPGVNLVGVRVLGEDGSGTYERVIQGIQWVVQHKDEYKIRVLNLSLVSPVRSPYWADPLNRAVMAAWSAGIVVVTAAGNDGPAAATITVPGNNPYAITAGAYTDAYTPLKFGDDYLADFSSAGPTLDGFTKPDVLAPGGHIVSTMPPGSYVARQYPNNRVDSQYYKMAGTSQAAAIVSGVAALVIAQNPGLTPNQVKYRIQVSALPWTTPDTARPVYSIWQQGFGRVNAPDAVFADLHGEANQGMDIAADLAGTRHYEGYSYYDQATGTFRLHGEFAEIINDYVTWDGHYTPGTGAIGAWSGAIGAWSGAIGAWSGAIGAWSGAIGAWSGAIGAWSGAIGAWSGAIGAWSGALGAWSGALGAWSGALGAWSGALGAWSGALGAWSGSVVVPATTGVIEH